MANQPLPSWPWLILGSKRSVAPPPPPPQAQPPAARLILFGQALIRPTTTTQPLPQPSTAAGAPPFRVGNVSLVPSYPPSQKIPPPSDPSPSTLTLPPQPIQKKPNLPFKASINGGLLLQKDVPGGPAVAKPTIVPDCKAKDHKGDQRQTDSKDDSILIIRVAGDNMGCLMEANRSCPASASLGKAFVVNSNVQDVNNSILVNTSCSTHDPAGVHVFFSPGGGR